MDNSINKTLDFYCEDEINSFMESTLYNSLKQTVDKTRFHIYCTFGPENSSNSSYNRWLSVEFHDESNKLVRIDEDSNLTIATMLILSDKKQRFKFFPWYSKEFEEDINWVLKHLKQMCDI